MYQLDDQGIINNNTQIEIDIKNTKEIKSISTNITTTSSSNSPTITPELSRKERQYIKQNQIPSVSATNSPTIAVANNDDSSGYRPTLQQTTRDRIRFTWPPTTSPAPTIQIVTDSPTTVKRWKKNNRDSAVEESDKEIDTVSPTDSPIKEEEEEDIETKEIRESASPTLQVTQSNTKRRDRKKTNPNQASNTTATDEQTNTEPDSTKEKADTSQNNNNQVSQPTQYPTYLGTTYYPTLSWPTYTPTTFGERPNYIQKMISQREKKELARQQALEEAERLANGELGSEGGEEGSSKSPSSSQVPTSNTHAYGVNNSVSRPLSHGGLGTELIPTPSPNSTPTKKEKKEEQDEEENLGYQGRGYQDVADSRTNHAFSRFDSTPQPTAKPIVNEEEVYLRFANDGLTCNNATKDECKLLTDKCAWDKQSGSCDEAVSTSPTESNPYDTSGRTWGSSSGRGGSQPTGRYSTFDDTDAPTPSPEVEVEETNEETSRWKPRTNSPTNEDTPLPSYSPTISPVNTEIPSYSPTISPIVPVVEEVFERFVNPEPRVSSSDEDDDTESGGLSLKFHVPEKEPKQTTKLSLTFQVPTSTSPTAHPITSNPTSDEPTYFVFPTFSPTVPVVDTPIPTLWPSYMPTVGRAKRDISDDGFIVPLPEEGTISSQEDDIEMTIYEKRMCQEYPNGIHSNSKKIDEPIVFMYGIQVSSSSTTATEGNDDERVSIEQEVERLQLSILDDVAKHLLICPTDKKDDEISSSSLVRSSFNGHRFDQYVSRVYYMEDESIATLSEFFCVFLFVVDTLLFGSHTSYLIHDSSSLLSQNTQVNALQQFLVLQTVQLLRVPSI